MVLNVKQKFETYPKEIKGILLQLRETILAVAKEQDIIDFQETLKSGSELSYKVR